MIIEQDTKRRVFTQKSNTISGFLIKSIVKPKFCKQFTTSVQPAFLLTNSTAVHKSNA